MPRPQLGPVLSQARARVAEQRLLTLAEVQAQLEHASAPVLRMPAPRKVHPFYAALSLLVLPPAARRIVPRQQQRKVLIRISDVDSRARSERRAGL